ncbi:MAG: hypothetical protein P4M07_27565 [Xanthobacteraceae bacterium]|nr:hypothetical protein [Xanthobacteraceae bacterium]
MTAIAKATPTPRRTRSLAARWCAAVAVVMASSAALAQGQPLPVLVEIPANIAAARPLLVGQRGDLQKERSTLHDTVMKLNTDCANIKESDTATIAGCTTRKQNLATALSRHIDKSNAFNGAIKAAMQCVRWSDQLASDRSALERQQKTGAMGLEELARWKKANEDAQNDALKTAAKLLLGAVADQLQDKIRSLNGFKGALTRYQNLAEKKHIPLGVLRDKIERAAQGYANTMVLVSGGRLMEGAGTLTNTLSVVGNEVAVIGGHMAQTNDSVRELLDDPGLKELLESDSAGIDLSKDLVAMAATSQQLARLQRVVGPGADLASFIVDYGYDAVKWKESRDRIVQQYQLSDQGLEAVAALKAQIECTVQRLHDCEAGREVGPCGH